MKALHVVPAVAARYGGPSEAAVRMAVALRSAGVEALVAATDADGRDRLQVETGTVLAYCGAKAVFFPRLPGESLKASPALARWVRAHVSEFDVVHVHSIFSHSSVAAGLAARRAGVPYVLRPLGQLDAWSLGQHAWRKRLFLASFGTRLAESAAMLHWTDASERTRAPDFAASRPGFVLPLGVDEELFDGHEDLERSRTILFLSRIHPKKNVEGLLMAFGRLGDAAGDWKLVIAGDGEPGYVASLKRLAASAGGRVEFVGWLSGEEKKRAIREAGLFVLPSHQENFGVAVAEAMAAGLPVIVSASVALASEIDRVGAGWVASAEESGLEDVLREAIGAPEGRKRRGAAARELAEKSFRWRQTAEALVREYEAILAGSRGSR